MERKTKVFITILVILVNTLSLITDIYAGQASATASIIIIIPERPSTANQTQLSEENIPTQDVTEEEKDLVLAKDEKEN